MQDSNIVVVVGRLVRDPEMKFTAGGLAVCNFDIANNKGRDKEGKEGGASFFNCVSFGKGAELVQRYCSKGKKVLIEGSLDQNRWTDKEGRNRSRVQIIANKVTFLDGGKAKSESGPPTDQGGSPPASQQGGEPSKGSSEEAPPYTDDDVPFD